MPHSSFLAPSRADLTRWLSEVDAVFQIARDAAQAGNQRRFRRAVDRQLVLDRGDLAAAGWARLLVERSVVLGPGKETRVFLRPTSEGLRFLHGTDRVAA